MKENEQIHVPLNYDGNLKIILDETINVILMEKYLDNNFNRYLMLICPKEKLKDKKELKIYGNEKSIKYKIDLQKNFIFGEKNKVFQISANGTIITFIRLDIKEEIYKQGEFGHPEDSDLKEYKEHIDKLNEEENKEKNICRKFSYIKRTLVVIILFSLVAFIINFVCRYVNGDKNAIEENNDPALKYIIKIYVKNYDKEKNITIKYNNYNIKYIGPIKNHLAEGNGIFYSKDNNKTIIYKGNFLEGCPNGNGVRYYYNGNKSIGYYNGSWNYNERSGLREMYNETEGSIYNGLWEEDKKNGKGKLNYSNGDYYIGGFKNDKFDGKGEGKIHYPNGDLYEGEFIDGKRHGQGK